MIQMLLREWKLFLIHVQSNDRFFSNLLLVFAHLWSLIFSTSFVLEMFHSYGMLWIVWFGYFFFFCVCKTGVLEHCKSSDAASTVQPIWVHGVMNAQPTTGFDPKRFFPSDFMTVTYLHLKYKYFTYLPILQLYLPFWISNFHPVVFVPIWYCKTIVRKQMSEISNSN